MLIPGVHPASFSSLDHICSQARAHVREHLGCALVLGRLSDGGLREERASCPVGRDGRMFGGGTLERLLNSWLRPMIRSDPNGSQAVLRQKD